MLTFDIPDSLFAKEIYSAHITMLTAGGDGGGVLHACAVSRAWDQNSVSWQLLQNDTTIVGTTTCYDNGARYTIPVTYHVQKILNGQAENYGFILGFQNAVPFYHPSDELDIDRKQTAGNFQCDTLTLYKPGLSFSGGDVTVYNRQVYQCDPGANSVFCNMAGYEPGSVGGQAAWAVIGDCIPRSVNIHSLDASDNSLQPELVIHISSTHAPQFNSIEGTTKPHFVASNGVIHIPDSYQGYRLTIRNMRGQLTYSQNISSKKIVLHSVSDGMYLAEISNNNNKTEKFRLLLRKK